MDRKILEPVLKTIRRYEMVNAGDSVLVAVSGGPDSVFLLDALTVLKNKLGIRNIIVANLDHGLRGKESRDDSKFVKELSRELGLQYVQKKIDLKETKESGVSTEEAGREARYKFFVDVAKKYGANVIATGHTLDDQAETVLMRVVKGASLKGLVGIAPVREDHGLRIIRPLIEIEKNAIKKYLDISKSRYRVDSSNIESIYFRNVVRNEILPFLEKYNPRLKRSLFNVAEHLREDFEFIDEARKSKARLISFGKNGAVELKLKDIVIQPKALQKEILRDALDAIGGEVKRLTFRHWKDLESFIRYKRKGDSIDLPGAIRVTRSEDRLTFNRLHLI